MLAISGTWVLLQGGGQGSGIIGFLPIVAILVIFYFLLIRPKQREMKKHQEMLGRLERGDRVLTSGGIIGEILSVKDDVVVLKIDKSSNVKVEFTKSSVARRLGEEGK